MSERYIIHSSMGGDIVFESEDSLEHFSFRRNKANDSTVGNDQIYKFSKDLIDDCKKLYLKSNIDALSDEDRKKVLTANTYSLKLTIGGVDILNTSAVLTNSKVFKK